MSEPDYSDPTDCSECGGHRVISYGGFRNEPDGCRDLPCPKCNREPDEDYEDD